MFDVNPSLIRFWESKFEILKPDKNKKGNRMFTPRDVDNLKLIYHLVKENGMTLAGARKRMKENRDGIEKSMDVIEKLQGVRSLLMEIKQELVGSGDERTEILIEEPSADPVVVLPDKVLPEVVTEEVVAEEVVVENAAGQNVGAEVERSSEPEIPKRPQIIEQTLF